MRPHGPQPHELGSQPLKWYKNVWELFPELSVQIERAWPLRKTTREGRGPMCVSNILVKNVDLAKGEEPAWIAAERMHQRAVGTLVVVNELQQPVGILTDRDLVERVLASGLDARDTTVAEAMTKEPVTISESASLECALAAMRSGKFRRLPVVNGEGKLCGMVSVDDVLMQIARELSLVGDLLKEETPAANIA
jgi:CBS domain-containing protein